MTTSQICPRSFKGVGALTSLLDSANQCEEFIIFAAKQ